MLRSRGVVLLHHQDAYAQLSGRTLAHSLWLEAATLGYALSLTCGVANLDACDTLVKAHNANVYISGCP